MELSSSFLLGANAMDKPQSCPQNATAAFFAVYVGISMNPILHESEVIEVRPYCDRPLRVGDVIFFRVPASDRFVIHRMTRITPTGISTRGDNSNREDSFRLNPGDIKGQVVAVWRGDRKRHKIAGGWQGRLTRHWSRWKYALGRCASPMLRPIYRTPALVQWFTWILPESMRPRVIAFGAPDADKLLLMSGRRRIGQYDNRQHQWRIQRPYQLLVDRRTLPTPGVVRADHADRAAVPESRQSGNPEPQSTGYDLVLADGSHWCITGGNAEAAVIVAQLAGVMQLVRSSPGTEHAVHDNHYRLSIEVATPLSVEDCFAPVREESNGRFVSVICPSTYWGGPYVNLVRLSLIFARQVEAGGGFLIHGALAERDGAGVILAASGGTGKTTASKRLSAPWHSLCDDTTLIVRDALGHYWAHPWPTWSRFIVGGLGGTWNVQNAVRLKGIFFLSRASEDRVEKVGGGQAVSMLMEAAKQASMVMEQHLSAKEIRTLHLQRFDTVCTLSGSMPSHILHFSPTGAFWEEIEQELKLGRHHETWEPADNGNADVSGMMNRTQRNFCLILRDHLSATCKSDIEKMSVAEWRLIYEIGCDNHLPALLFYKLKNHQIVFPAKMEMILRMDYLRFSGHDLRRKAQLYEMIRLFNVHGIDHILLKGSHLAEKFYSNSALRPMCDIDVLIKKSDFKTVYELLTTAGYTSSKPNNHDSQSGNNKHFPPLLKVGGLAIELHWNIDSQNSDRSMEQLWSRSEAMAIGDLKTRILCPEDLLRHIAFHKGYDDVFLSSLMVLNDIKEICSGSAVDWDKLLSLATPDHEWGNTKYLFSALHLSGRLLGANIPERVVDQIRPDDFDLKYEGLLIRQLFTGISSDMTKYRTVNALYKLSRSFRPRQWLQYLTSPGKLCLIYDKKYSWRILPGLYCRRIMDKSRYAMKIGIGMWTNNDNKKLYETSKASSEMAKWLKR